MFGMTDIKRTCGDMIRDLDLLTIGLVNEMFIESRNDEYPWAEVGDQQAMDAF